MRRRLLDFCQKEYRMAIGMPAETRPGPSGDQLGALHVAPRKDSGVLQHQRLGPFTDYVATGVALKEYAQQTLPLEDPDDLFARLEQHAQKAGEHLMIVSGGHVPEIAMSGLLFADGLHRVSGEIGEDYAYVTTAERLAEDIFRAHTEQALLPDAMLHLLQATSQEVRTAETFSAQVAKRRTLAVAFRPTIERGFQTGKSMEHLLGLIEAVGIPVASENNAADVHRLRSALSESVTDMTGHLRELDTPSH